MSYPTLIPSKFSPKNVSTGVTCGGAGRVVVHLLFSKIFYVTFCYFSVLEVLCFKMGCNARLASGELLPPPPAPTAKELNGDGSSPCSEMFLGAHEESSKSLSSKDVDYLSRHVRRKRVVQAESELRPSGPLFPRRGAHVVSLLVRATDMFGRHFWFDRERGALTYFD